MRTLGRSRKTLVDVLKKQMEREGEENALIADIMDRLREESKKAKVVGTQADLDLTI